MDSLYYKYSDILKHLYNLMNLTNDKQLKEQLKQNIIIMISDLYKKDVNNRHLYLKLLEEFNLDINLEEITYKDNIDESLKIVKAKKSYNSDIKNRTLSLLALHGKEIKPNLRNGLGIGSYYLYKNGIQNAKSLVEKNGYNIDDNNNLLDKYGRIVSDEYVNRLKYDFIKKELLNVDDGEKFDANYKKNKLMSLLLNIPVKGNIKKQEQDLDYVIEDSIEIKDINKGLGIIK